MGTDKGGIRRGGWCDERVSERTVDGEVIEFLQARGRHDGERKAEL